MRRLIACALLLAVSATGCSDDRSTGTDTTEPDSAPPATVARNDGEALTTSAADDRWVPSPDDTWQWQLEGAIDTGWQVDVYDIDLFDAPDGVISDLRDRGVAVVCYFSAGSWEEWRTDADRFPAEVIGETLDGWEDERWLDVTDSRVFEIMEDRLDLAAERGCDGVEPDNVAAYDDDTGFDFDRADQAAYNRALAEAAHARGLQIGLKNALELIPELEPLFDFAVNEQCWEFNECDATQPFVDAGKPVFNAEYAQRFVEEPDEVCARAVEFGMRTLILPLDLDNGFRISCDGA